MRVPTVDQTNLRRRVAQFGWLTIGLAAAAIGLLVVATALVVTQDQDFQLHDVVLPLNVEVANPGGAVLAAAGLLAASTFFGLAALQTAAVMRLLDPDRHVPPPPSSTVLKARQVMLGPAVAGPESIERLADSPPPSALPGPEELPGAGTVVIAVSRRDGQVTLRVSSRTSCRKRKGLTRLRRTSAGA